MYFELSDDFIGFPHPSLSDDDGLLAIGGDLSPERLKLAYAFGIFPWYSPGEPILWYSPEVRCVLFPEELHISHSMRSIMRSGQFRLTWNQAFDQVIDQCAQLPRKGQSGTWIGSDMAFAYKELHRLGRAQSVEVWEQDKLVGGLYGVIHLDIFCGESMFSLVPNASKRALIELCQSGKFRLIDCQMTTEHLLRMGAREISKAAFLAQLRYPFYKRMQN